MTDWVTEWMTDTFDCWIGRSVSRSVRHSVSRSVNHSFSQSVNQSFSQSFSQPVSQSFSQSVSRETFYMYLPHRDTDEATGISPHRDTDEATGTSHSTRHTWGYTYICPTETRMGLATGISPPQTHVGPQVYPPTETKIGLQAYPLPRGGFWERVFLILFFFFKMFWSLRHDNC